MPDPNYHPDLKSRSFIAFFLLGTIIFLIYSNTFNCSWHFDDYNTIVHNPRLHMETIDLGSIRNAAFACPTGDRLYRPLPMISLALNWYVGKDRVKGYHLINILIHVITACLLFATIQQLMGSPVGKEQKLKNPYFIALLAALIWAVHPIQVQAVTYIVQRMAAMATLFYMSSLFFHLKLRLSASTRSRIFFFIGSLASYIAAILSKENAVILPFSILLIECIFFNQPRKEMIRRILGKKRTAIFIIIFTSMTLILGLVFFYKPVLTIIEDSYHYRPFTLFERLMTESRILAFYLSLIVYPALDRFSINHVFPISKSPIDPLTTIISIIFILFLIVYSIFHLRRRPFLSFAILFFFVNHIIESSFLGLELIFEHRNYLPSTFIFIPLSIIIYRFVDKFYDYQKRYATAVVCVGVFIVFFLSMTTYVRNFDWKNTKTLWENVLVRYPESTRALNNLANGYYMKIGDYDKALKLYNKALAADWSNASRTYRSGETLSNVAGIYYGFGMDRKALAIWDRAIEAYPANIQAMLFKAEAQISLGQFDDALVTLDTIPTTPPTQKSLALKTLIFFKQGKLNKAISTCRNSLQINPNDLDCLFYMGAIYSKIGQYKKSNFFLNSARAIHRNELRVLFALLENAIIIGDSDNRDKYLESITTSANYRDVWSTLKQSNKNEKIPFNVDAVVPLLIEKNRQDTGSRIQLLEQLIADPAS